MPIQPPNLIDLPDPIPLRFEDLVREARRRIPLHNPEWTDHNDTDPGITLVQLFAWMTEALAFRLNRVGDKHYRAFLELVGASFEPAFPARVVVAFSAGPEAAAGLVVPAGHRVRAGEVGFTTREECVVWPIGAAAFLKEAFVTTVAADGTQAGTLVDLDAASAGGVAVTRYRTRAFPAITPGQSTPALGVTGAADGTLWVRLTGDPRAFGSLAPGAPLLGGEEITVNVGVTPDETPASDRDVLYGGPAAGKPGGRLAVERSTGRWLRNPTLGADGALVDPGLPAWEPVQVAEDTTQGLARTGVVRLRLPPVRDWRAWDALPDSGAPIAGTSLDGAGLLPPLQDAPEDTTTYRVWLRIAPLDPFRPVRLTSVLAHGATAIQAETVVNEPLGTSTGAASQSFQTAHGNVLGGDVAVQVVEQGEFRDWQRVPDFDDQGAEARVYTVDAAEGRVTFGDGAHGRVPPPGAALRARRYRHSRGAAGNAGAGTLSAVDALPSGGPAPRVVNPFAATGGADAETLDEVQARIPRTLRHKDRAVTAADWSDLALGTPGIDLARADVLPLFEPYREGAVPGVVTVVAVPRFDVRHRLAPRPDRDALRRVCEHLGARRPVTSEVYVVGPEYVPVWISVAVALESGAGIAVASHRIRDVLEAFLDPRTGGRGGTGWPLGEKLRASRLEALVTRVAGVAAVEELRLLGLERDRVGSAAWASDGEVRLTAWQLPELMRVSVQLFDPCGAPAALPVLPADLAALGVPAPPGVPLVAPDDPGPGFLTPAPAGEVVC
jgi:predicted phage baseplate assembly protein